MDETVSKHQSTVAANDPSKESTGGEAVWTFRGYRLKASEFTTAMVHFFRAEVQRANVWRQRLDTTTNWAVVTTGAVLSIAFSQSSSNHAVILINILLVTVFLLIEARRYRYYELWSYRVRLMETDFFAAMLVPPFHPSPEWSEALAENLLHPHYPISFWEALGRRLRRNYLYIYGIIGVAWLAKLWLYPQAAANWQIFSSRATIGSIDGFWVLILMVLFYLGIVLLSIGTANMQQAAGEVLPRFGSIIESTDQIHKDGAQKKDAHAWFRPVHRRKQLLTLIITNRAQELAERVLKEMGRGITSIDGVGMYTRTSHNILLCALTVTEIPQLKIITSEIDPNAFVIVTPAQEIFGRGFQPIHE